MDHQLNPLTDPGDGQQIWLHLFGNGLVRTADNFGTAAASHPELLDIAPPTSSPEAGRSSRPSIHRPQPHPSVVQPPDQADAMADPGDRMVWRMSPRRLEAESIRDAMLAASGQLNLARQALVADDAVAELQGTI